MEKKRSLILNAEYAAGLGAYWMIYAVIGSFSSVFMLAKGYSNAEIGVVLALANVAGLAAQLLVADYIDRAGKGKIIGLAIAAAAAIMLLAAGMFTFRGASLALASVFVFAIAIHTVMQPPMNALPFKIKERPEDDAIINFGIGRAGGSLGFSVVLAILGTEVERRGVMMIPLSCEIVCALFIIMMIALRQSSTAMLSGSAGALTDAERASEEELPSPAGGAPSESVIDVERDADAASAAVADSSAERKEAEGADADEEYIGLRDFIEGNRMFFIMNLGIAGLFFSNSVLTNYMAQISAAVNGTTEDLGRILSLMAFLEVPTMVVFKYIRKHFSGRTLIKVASIGFTLKIAICWLAGSVTGLYAAQFCQLFAFALLMPAMVYFTDEIMRQGEAVKGQALFIMMIALSSIGASLAGGWIMDAYSVKTMTMLATVITAIGAVIVICAVDRIEDKKQLLAP